MPSLYKMHKVNALLEGRVFSVSVSVCLYVCLPPCRSNYIIPGTTQRISANNMNEYVISIFFYCGIHEKEYNTDELHIFNI
jgi:hypothetical protein